LISSAAQQKLMPDLAFFRTLGLRILTALKTTGESQVADKSEGNQGCTPCHYIVWQAAGRNKSTICMRDEIYIQTVSLQPRQNPWLRIIDRTGQNDSSTMLNAHLESLICFPSNQRPLLIVTVDTEEEFDWTKPLARGNTLVTHIGAQVRAQRLYAKYGIKPTYFIDYPVAEQEQAYRPLREWFADRSCEIGAHLHPWVNPPFDEQVCNRNSYPGNLPAALERAKLLRLTELIEERFGSRPTVYRAGRYGAGPNTEAILEELGYEIDTSVLARSDLRPHEGPDFSAIGLAPYWFGRDRKLLEIPVTVGWDGWLAPAGMSLQKAAQSWWGRALKIQGLLARSGAFNRVKLTPEGIPLAELCQATEAMLAAGCRVFNFTYHSPSLAPGHTPYVRTDAELKEFLVRIERYLDFFFDKCRGIAATPHTVRSLSKRVGSDQA
jgi:peptidoglycan/xylan/chitin deacetylase (PgdA/CDA1 family)